MNLTVTPIYPQAVVALITSYHLPVSAVPGVTMPGTSDAYVNSTVVGNANLNPYGRSVSMGTAEGRIGAHEVVQHGFLGRQFESLVDLDVARGRASGMNAFATNTSRFDMSADTAVALGKLCPPSPPHTNPLHEGLHGGGGGRQVLGPGFGEFPFWWNSMRQLLAWLNSIPVGQAERKLEAV